MLDRRSPTIAARSPRSRASTARPTTTSALTEILLRQADAASADVDDRVGALVEAAGLYVAAATAPTTRSPTWEQVLAVAPERRDAVDALEALYREQGRWPDVVDLYERRLGFATSIEEAVALRVQLGEIHEKQLHDVETAIDNYTAALSGDPRNASRARRARALPRRSGRSASWPPRCSSRSTSRSSAGTI